MNPLTNRSSLSNLGRADLAGLAFLALLPSLLYAPALIQGEIPLAMDPVMYFFPLRWHAAHQVLSGHLPWWNRSILGGMPLFANPQAALSYPLNWPMLLRPGALAFAFPMTLQLGLWAAFSALLLRRLGVARLPAFWAGCLCLAGNYGWSRFQYGNYLNVLPWWPVALLAAHEFAASARRGFLVMGGGAAALMILAGAHQLALYGSFALAAYLLFMAAADRTAYRRWAGFAIVSAALGILLGATGWLPQWAFLSETARAGAIDHDAILSGTFASLREIAQALTGLHGGGPADPESSASVGAIALVIAGLIPRRRALVLPWMGAWIMVLITVLPAWRPVTSLLLRVVPAAAVFHDPRRLLGVAQWGIILASGISLASWIEAASTSPRPVHRHALRSLPAALIGAFLLISVPWRIDSPWSWLTIAVVVLMVASPLGAPNIPQSVPQRRRALWAISASALAALWGLTTLGLGTLRDTDFSRVRAENLFTRSGAAPMIQAAALESPRRFFSLDWQRSTSYDYRRPDLAAWGLPNMAMLFGLEDIGGYEPARSVRYDRWRSGLSAWPQGIQPWSAHFGLLYPHYPGLALQFSTLADANLGAAILPRWGFPVYLSQIEALHWAGLSPRWPANVELRVVYLPAGQEAAGASRSVTLMQSSLRSTDYALDSRLRLEGDGALLPSSDAGAAGEPERKWLLRGSFVTHRLPAQTGEDSPDGSSPSPGLLPADGSLARVDLRLSSGPEGDDVPIGVFLWSEDLARVYRPLVDDELAMVCLYEGPARWTSFFPARVSPLQAEAVRGPEPSGEVLSFSIEPNRLDLRVRWSGSEPGTLEIHDAYWKGWRATVNGRSVEVRPSGPGAQGLWRQITIPPGEAEVVLTYHPPLVGFSLALTMIGVICCVLICRPGRRESASEKNSVKFDPAE